MPPPGRCVQALQPQPPHCCRAPPPPTAQAPAAAAACRFRTPLSLLLMLRSVPSLPRSARARPLRPGPAEGQAAARRPTRCHRARLPPPRTAAGARPRSAAGRGSSRAGTPGGALPQPTRQHRRRLRRQSWPPNPSACPTPPRLLRCPRPSLPAAATHPAAAAAVPAPAAAARGSPGSGSTRPKRRRCGRRAAAQQGTPPAPDGTAAAAAPGRRRRAGRRRCCRRLQARAWASGRLGPQRWRGPARQRGAAQCAPTEALHAALSPRPRPRLWALHR